MSVLIKGMEMPKNCDECRIMALEDTNCEAELYCGCPIAFQAHPQGVGYRPDYCPLIEIPPHGRLIDADAPMRFEITIDGGTNMCVADIYAPTVIEAEEET